MSVRRAGRTGLAHARRYSAFASGPHDPYNALTVRVDRPGTGSGPLKDWTVSIKENICMTDAPTTCGSRMLASTCPCLPDYTSPFDAAVVEHLAHNGAKIMGRTNCDEFGMGYVGNLM